MIKSIKELKKAIDELKDADFRIGASMVVNTRVLRQLLESYIDLLKIKNIINK